MDQEMEESLMSGQAQTQPHTQVTPVVSLDRLAELLDTASLRKARGQDVEKQSLTEFSDLCLGCSSEALNTFQSSGYTLLQKCATGNLADFAEVLLQREGVDARYWP